MSCSQSDLNNCSLCNTTTLIIVNGRCISQCGDGLVLDGEVCDDENIMPGDGCSEDCLTI